MGLLVDALQEALQNNDTRAVDGICELITLFYGS